MDRWRQAPERPKHIFVRAVFDIPTSRLGFSLGLSRAFADPLCKRYF